MTRLTLFIPKKLELCYKNYRISQCGRFEFNPLTNLWEFRKFYIASFKELEFRYHSFFCLYRFIYISFRSVRFPLHFRICIDTRKDDLIFAKGFISPYEDHHILHIRTCALNDKYVMSFMKKSHGFQVHFYYKANKNQYEFKKEYLRIEANRYWKLYNVVRKLNVRKTYIPPEILRDFYKKVKEPIIDKKSTLCKLPIIRRKSISTLLKEIISDEYRTKYIFNFLKMNIYLRLHFCKIVLKQQKILSYATGKEFKDYPNENLYFFKKIPKLKKRFKGYITKLINEKYFYLNDKDIKALLILYEDYENYIIKHNLHLFLLYPPLIDCVDIIHLLKKNTKYLKKLREILERMDITLFKLYYPKYNLKDNVTTLKITFTKIIRIILFIEQRKQTK